MTFLITSPVLDALKSRYEDAEKLILDSIEESRPIVVRHHNDCDGYCSGVALERAILPLVERKKKQYARKYYRRSPLKAPYYDYKDVIRDVTMALTDKANYERKMPLIIILDNGSTAEDYLALKKAKLHGCKLMVVDHHSPGPMSDGKCQVDEVVDVHINPHLEGFNGILCTGMLATELAMQLHPEAEDVLAIPAVAGVADHCEGDEFDQYMEMAKKQGFEEELIRKMSTAVNWEAYHCDFIDSRHLFGILLGPRTKEQEEMVDLSWKHITKEREHFLKALVHYVKEEDHNGVKVAFLDTEQLAQWGSYFSSGKITSLCHHHLAEKYEEKVLTIGFGPSFFTFRAKNGIIKEGGEPFDVNGIIAELQSSMPHALVDGGGHAQAGTLRCIPAAQSHVLEWLQSFCRTLK